MNISGISLKVIDASHRRIDVYSVQEVSYVSRFDEIFIIFNYFKTFIEYRNSSLGRKRWGAGSEPVELEYVPGAQATHADAPVESI
jgi:hypothetical protein